MGFRSLLLLVLVTVGLPAAAQRNTTVRDTVLKGSTIEVVQSYKPQIYQTPKPTWIPQLPPTDTTHPSFNYEVPQQTLYYTYSSMPLRPLALGKENAAVPYPGYIKLGGGNLSTLYFEGANNLHQTDYDVNLHFHYLSQEGNIKYQKTSIAGIEAEGLLHRQKADWHFGLSGERNQYYNYGYNHDIFVPNSDSVKQTYTSVNFNVDMKNAGNASSKLSYHPALTGYYYSAAFSTSEINVGLDLPVTYQFDKTVQALLCLKTDLAHLAVKSTGFDNSYAELLPGVKVDMQNFTGTALVGFAVGLKSTFYVLPDISAVYSLKAQHLQFNAGLQSSLGQNTYKQLTTVNPYLSNNYATLQSKTDEYYVGAKGSLSDHFDYSGRISYWNYKALPQFLNNYYDNRRFNVVYDTLNAVSFRVGGRYKVAEKWSAGISGDFFAYSKKVWHQPSVCIKADYNATFFKKLNAGAYISFLGGIYALDNTSKTILLTPVLDAGVNAEYQIIPRLSAFVDLNNIFNNKNQRWYGYQAYGINIYGGLRLKF